MTPTTPMAAIRAALGGDLLGGQVAIVLAPPGVGKTAMVVYVAVDAMLAGSSVLHVAVHDTVDHVRAHYDQVTRAMELPAAVVLAAERKRMVHSYLGHSFEVSQLAAHLKLLRDVAQFHPGCIIVDGLCDETVRASVEPLRALGEELNVPLWITLRQHGDEIPEEVRVAGNVGIRLRPKAGAIELSVLREGTETALPFKLSPDSLLIAASRTGTSTELRPDRITLYSGGAEGAEAVFGELAAAHGLHEQNFSFAGHKQARTAGRRELSPRELAAGDVSMVYVSRRLHRTYHTEGTTIRKILQTLWHMVSRSQKVFVIGAIQADDTVIGGTGWSVELARMWNKDLWVYDQVQQGWFHWTGHAWVPGVPVIDALHVTGTGTRHLEPHGRTAIEDLFARSFSD